MYRFFGNQFKEVSSAIAKQAKVVDVVDAGDYCFLKNKFSQTHTLFLNRCDKNFTFYHLCPSIFPNVRKIYLNSHPCEYSVVHRFPRNIHFFMEEGYYQRYATRWEYKYNVVPVSEKQISAVLQKIEHKNGSFNEKIIETLWHP